MSEHRHRRRRRRSRGVACARRLRDACRPLPVTMTAVSRRGGDIGVCGLCMDARGISEVELAAGCRRSTTDELSDWSRQADRFLIL